MNKNITNDSSNPKTRICEKAGGCDFSYERWSDNEKECYQCKKCGDFYWIFEDEMK